MIIKAFIKLYRIIYSIYHVLLFRYPSEIKYYFLNKFSKNYGVTKIKRETPLVVTLTSFPQRINRVYLAIETILRQSEKPDYIYLWLSKEEFPKLKKGLPKEILDQEKRGLEIKFSENNFKSYNKLIHSLKENPNSTLITFDDDIFYRKDTIKNLYEGHKKYKNEIICILAGKITLQTKNSLNKYLMWDVYHKEESSPFILPLGVGGVLYPKNSLNKEIFNEKVFMEICPFGDDIWFKAMSLLNKTKCRKILDYNPVLVCIRSTQYVALHHTNVGKGFNDVQLEKVFKKYKLFSYLQN